MSELLKEAIQVFSDKKIIVSTGTVSRIKGNVCEVKREHLPPLLDVRLQALEGDFENHLLIKPKLNSEVVCLSIDGEDAEACVIKYTEIEGIDCEIKGLKIVVENGKLQIKNKSTDLGAALSELVSELTSAVIQTPAGLGSFSPKNIQKFGELSLKIKGLFK